uniref:PDZ domain-containing protein n=1 Tax=Anisakis simplex TaxID=6269 RepID=A0A0M3KID2_ANISI
LPPNKNIFSVDVSSAPTSPNREQRRILTPDSFPDLFEEKSITIICPGGAAPKLRISRNLQVLRIPDGSLAQNRLDPGDFLLKVDGKEIGDKKQFYRMMQDIAKDPDCQAVIVKTTSIIKLLSLNDDHELIKPFR